MNTSAQVADSCFELLHMQMVDYFIAQAEKEEGVGKDPLRLEKKVHSKLQNLGFDVGHRLAERYTKDLQRFTGQLNIIKFICKEFWQAVFRKPVDKLQTNYRGIYVLHDNKFSWISKISGTPEQCKPYLAFACGVIKGALSNLGVKASVMVEISPQAACEFRIVDISQARRISSRAASSGQAASKTS
eukprot:gb/GEZN01011147.1/.p1 GENE.gb/GEZN01011147.1/~~gb/GEZN01011147.1/.p1  ORF type:complete len:187 (-),score=35.69 gb/GEZN01011147.1/:525-1085(-)